MPQHLKFIIPRRRSHHHHIIINRECAWLVCVLCVICDLRVIHTRGHETRACGLLVRMMLVCWVGVYPTPGGVIHAMTPSPEEVRP